MKSYDEFFSAVNPDPLRIKGADKLNLIKKDINLDCTSTGTYIKKISTKNRFRLVRTVFHILVKIPIIKPLTFSINRKKLSHLILVKLSANLYNLHKHKTLIF